MSTYKPSEHDGLTKDGRVDKRVNQSADSAEEDGSPPTESTGNSGNQPEEIYKPSEHDGLKKDGSPDKRMSSDHGFGGRPHEEVVEAARKGGRTSGSDVNKNPDDEDETYIE